MKFNEKNWTQSHILFPLSSFMLHLIHLKEIYIVQFLKSGHPKFRIVHNPDISLIVMILFFLKNSSKTKKIKKAKTSKFAKEKFALLG